MFKPLWARSAVGAVRSVRGRVAPSSFRARRSLASESEPKAHPPTGWPDFKRDEKGRWPEEFWTSFPFDVHTDGSTTPTTMFSRSPFVARYYDVKTQDIHNSNIYARADRARVSNADEEAATSFFNKFRGGAGKK